jgi:hypothetical protein
MTTIMTRKERLSWPPPPALGFLISGKRETCAFEGARKYASLFL